MVWMVLPRPISSAKIPFNFWSCMVTSQSNPMCWLEMELKEKFRKGESESDLIFKIHSTLVRIELVEKRKLLTWYSLSVCFSNGGTGVTTLVDDSVLPFGWILSAIAAASLIRSSLSAYNRNEKFQFQRFDHRNPININRTTKNQLCRFCSINSLHPNVYHQTNEQIEMELLLEIYLCTTAYFCGHQFSFEVDPKKWLRCNISVEKDFVYGKTFTCDCLLESSSSRLLRPKLSFNVSSTSDASRSSSASDSSSEVSFSDSAVRKKENGIFE